MDLLKITYILSALLVVNVTYGATELTRFNGIRHLSLKVALI